MSTQEFDCPDGLKGQNFVAVGIAHGSLRAHKAACKAATNFSEKVHKINAPTLGQDVNSRECASATPKKTAQTHIFS